MDVRGLWSGCPGREAVGETDSPKPEPTGPLPQHSYFTGTWKPAWKNIISIPNLLRWYLGTKSKTCGKTGFLVWTPCERMQLNHYLGEQDPWSTSGKWLRVALSNSLGCRPRGWWEDMRVREIPLRGCRPAAQRRAISVYAANLWAQWPGLGTTEWRGACLPGTPLPLLGPWQPFIRAAELDLLPLANCITGLGTLS